MTFINVKYINLTFPLIVYNTTYSSTYTIIQQGHIRLNTLSNILGNTLFTIPIVYIFSFVCLTISTLYCLAPTFRTYPPNGFHMFLLCFYNRYFHPWSPPFDDLIKKTNLLPLTPFEFVQSNLSLG